MNKVSRTESDLVEKGLFVESFTNTCLTYVGPSSLGRTCTTWDSYDSVEPPDCPSYRESYDVPPNGSHVRTHGTRDTPYDNQFHLPL